MIANPDRDPNLEEDGPNAQPGEQPAAPPQPAATPPAPPPFNREQFRDQWMSTGTDVNRQNQLLSQNGLTMDGAGRTRLPTGETLDLRIGARSGQNLAGWTGIDGGGLKTGQSAMGGALGALGGGSGGAGGGGGFQDQIRQMLMRTLEQSQHPVDENSAEIKQPFDAASLDAQRQIGDEQKALAESLYASGGGSGSNELQQGIQQSRERVAGSLGGIKAQLIQRAQQAKQAQLQQALSLAVQSGDSEAARAIQLQMAQMSNALGYSQLNQQAGQFDANYGLNKADAQYQRDRDAARAKAGLAF